MFKSPKSQDELPDLFVYMKWHGDTGMLSVMLSYIDWDGTYSSMLTLSLTNVTESQGGKGKHIMD